MVDVIAGHYVAGAIGASLLRHWYRDGEQNAARFEELRQVVESIDAPLLASAINPEHLDLLPGYAEWAASYDGPNPLVEVEQPLVRDILTDLAGPDPSAVSALDAGCGTGRHAAFLAELGCQVTGVDQSPEMLAIARDKTPSAEFREGNLESLPVDDASFDLAVSSLAITHLADPSTAVADLGRVLRPGGTLVISDPHPMSAIVGGQAFFGFEPGSAVKWVENHYHGAATWLPAFRDAGLEVVDVREVTFSEQQIAASPASAAFPAAMTDLLTGVPSFWIWVVRRAG